MQQWRSERILTKWLESIETHPFFSAEAVISSSIQLRQLVKHYARKRILEVGAGSGYNAILLASSGLDVTAVDEDQAVVNLIRERASRFNVHLNVMQADLFDLPDSFKGFGVVYSQGLLEHFDEDMIRLALIKQRCVADYVIFEVPSEKWPRAPTSTWCYGNERFMSYAQWEKIIKAAKLSITRSYGWGWLPKYRVLAKTIPPLIWNRLSPQFANILGFVIK